MKLIIIESDIYRVTDKDYKELRDIKERFDNTKWYPGIDIDRDNLIQAMKHRFKLLGPVCFDYRL